MTSLFELHADEPRLRQLCLQDARLAVLVRAVGPLNVPKRTDGFEYLAKSLINQQLSVKAAATICQRVEQQCGGITPDSMLAASEDILRAAGVSRPKIGYIQGLAQLVKQGEIDFAAWDGMSDEEAIEALTKIKGIGRWTAEMFLIFFMGRDNVLSMGDAGLRRAALWLYEGEKGNGAAVLEQQSLAWEPYRSIASLYLWEAINQGHVVEGPYSKFCEKLAEQQRE
ncbi:DNA-3-methyladenine glycosylase family protein [Paenibacillus sp. OAS669]|uniref:DNA-3-methyladenine glycosylase family protein n=1 Tax=Paenibacillus sp. OAS669 TaxID=2663821 RepID=UPI001789DE4A|nr:DNA-3-methyladenine glycosylase 2 family protein [Paenibacillus sp. OAS669]MBE1445545.1 DNA-3-methyladenine glycosylase II [Paenibacillus sp. OAS669]